MLQIDDYVSHIGFPEVYGTVKIITPMPNNEYRIGVLVDDCTERIFYDMDNTWEKIQGQQIYQQEETYENGDFIEVEYEIIEQ